MIEPQSSPSVGGTEQPKTPAKKRVRKYSLTDEQRAAIDRFLVARYILSGLALAIIAFALGFVIQDLAIEKAWREAQKAAEEETTEIKEYLREQKNNYEAQRLRVQWRWERTEVVEAAVYQAFEAADLSSSTKAVVAAAGGPTPMREPTSYDLSNESRDLPHDLCFLVTMELDASKQQTCEVKQDSDKWVAEAQNSSCQFLCVDFE